MPKQPGTVSPAERKAVTLAYLGGPRLPVIIGPLCTCLEGGPGPHPPHREELERFDKEYGQSRAMRVNPPHKGSSVRPTAKPSRKAPKRRSR